MDLGHFPVAMEPEAMAQNHSNPQLLHPVGYTKVAVEAADWDSIVRADTWPLVGGHSCCNSFLLQRDGHAYQHEWMDIYWTMVAGSGNGILPKYVDYKCSTVDPLAFCHNIERRWLILNADQAMYHAYSWSLRRIVQAWALKFQYCHRAPEFAALSRSFQVADAVVDPRALKTD